MCPEVNHCETALLERFFLMKIMSDYSLYYQKTRVIIIVSNHSLGGII